MDRRGLETRDTQLPGTQCARVTLGRKKQGEKMVQKISFYARAQLPRQHIQQQWWRKRRIK